MGAVALDSVAWAWAADAVVSGWAVSVSAAWEMVEGGEDEVAVSGAVEVAVLGVAEGGVAWVMVVDVCSRGGR